MFPFVTDASEFFAARDLLLRERDALAARGRPAPESLEIGAMLETPAMVYAPDSFFRAADFISVGGNDLMQFFYAADRGNERVRKRYDALGPAWLTFLEEIVARCESQGSTLTFCGESAGRPLEALALAALGFRTLSMRPAAIGPVKRMLRAVDLGGARGVIARAVVDGHSAREPLTRWARAQGAPL
jgi:phosphotransferase system enzyme I (PtsP)